MTCFEVKYEEICIAFRRVGLFLLGTDIASTGFVILTLFVSKAITKGCFYLFKAITCGIVEAFE